MLWKSDGHPPEIEELKRWWWWGGLLFIDKQRGWALFDAAALDVEFACRKVKDDFNE